MGAMVTESVQSAVTGEQHGLKRQYGISPPLDPEEAPDESWALTYQGVIPKSEGVGGRFLENGLFHAPGKQFCTMGVQEGDLLIVEAAPQVMSDELNYPIELSFDGEACPLKPVYISRIQVTIGEVGEDTLDVDPATARRVPVAPQLDEENLSLSRLKGCRELVEQAKSELGVVNGMVPLLETQAFLSANLPDRLTFRVRTADWIVEGTRSGYTHRNTFVDGQCTEKETLSNRLTSRLQQATLVDDTYATCPPANDRLTTAGLESLVSAGSTFENHSFNVTMLPGCRNTAEGVELVHTRRDTRWSFSLNGTSSPKQVQVDGTMHSARTVPFDFRRQLIHLGTSGNRVTVLRVSPFSTVPISKFE